jgi:hypothetical protein
MELPPSQSTLPVPGCLELDLRRFLLFIDHAMLPNLQALMIPTSRCFNGFDDDSAVTQIPTAIPAFVRRSGCKLKKLHRHLTD